MRATLKQLPPSSSVRSNNSQKLTDEQWRLVTTAEGWTVGVTAHHVASTYESLAGLVNLIATGGDVPAIAMEMIDAANARHAVEYANVSKAETLELLRRDSAAAVSLLRGLDDAQLARTAPMAFAGGASWSAADVAERV